jgi:hypothetical protein
MKRRDGLLAALGCAAAVCPPLAPAQTPKPQSAQVGELKSLGQDRFQIGRIVVDKRARSFTVPGRVHVTGKPLEYLATSPGGMKQYEALFELDAIGSEFNLACILVGLERDPKLPPLHQSRQSGPLAGQRVAISVAWSVGGKRRQVPAADALLNPEAGVKPESVEWVYTGSYTTEREARFATDDTGTLIGFIPDANCIIESATGIGIGAYGSVRGNAMLPPVGSAIELIVEAANTTK